MAADEPIIFICPGKKGKPPHECTAEAVAALVYALDAPPDTWAIAGDGAALAEARAEKPKDTYKLSTLKRKLAKKLTGDKHLRVQVLCRDPDCATDSILTDALILDAEPEDGKARILLLLPTPGDLALIDAAKGITGLSAVKAATANATFVLGNLVLITTVATTLGLAKTEEIGAKLIKGGALWPLLVAVALGSLSIFFALSALVVRTGRIRSANLEEVRALLGEEVTWRSREARKSIWSLGLAVLALGVAFGWVAVKENQKDPKPAGTLTVVPDPGTLEIAIDTGWTEAPKNSRLEVTAVGEGGAPSFTHDADVKDGAAQLKRVVKATSTSGLITVTSRLIGVADDGSEAIEGASKEVCLEVRAGNLVESECQ
jgi:hypothetical protein